MGYEWIDKNHFENNQRKESKKLKIIVEMPHLNKILSRKRTFVQTPFSQCTFKLERKNFKPKKLGFRSTTYFGVTKNVLTKNALNLN